MNSHYLALEGGGQEVEVRLQPIISVAVLALARTSGSEGSDPVAMPLM